MITKRVVIDGMWMEVKFFLEDSQDIRVEIMNQLTMKHYKMYPDNKINIENFKESNNG